MTDISAPSLLLLLVLLLAVAAMGAVAGFLAARSQGTRDARDLSLGLVRTDSGGEHDVMWTFAGIPRRWRVSTGERLEEVATISDVYEGALVAGGELFVIVRRCDVGSQRTRVHAIEVFERSTWALVATHDSESANISAVAPTGDRVMVRWKGLAVRSLRTPEQLLRRWARHGHDRPHASATHAHEAWASDGGTVAVLRNQSTRPGNVECWNMTMDAPGLFPALERVRGWGLRFSSQGHQLAIIGDDGLSVLDRRTGGVMTAPMPRWAGYYTSALRWTACGLRIHGPKRVLDLDLAHGELRWRSQTWGAHSESPLEPTSDASGDRVVFLNADVPTIGDQDGVLRLLQPTPPHRGKSTRGGEAQAAFSPDGRWLMIQQVFAEDAVCFDVWDAQSGIHRFREYLPGFGTMLLVVDGQIAIITQERTQEIVSNLITMTTLTTISFIEL